jgi:hypothetical protein
MMKKQTAESFWARVKKSRRCWEWRGACNSAGYGTVSWGGHLYTAHRVAAWLSGLVKHPSKPTHASEPTHVLHKCDNRKCCNPKHFFLGSFSDNIRDAYGKKRRVVYKGESHANSKLTNKQVLAIRKAYTKGQTQMQLAAVYGVSQRTISLIVRGESYKWI